LGGHSGNRLRIGDSIGTYIAIKDVLELLKRCIDYYCANGRKKERASRFIKGIGVEMFQQALL
jgi:NAD(P)H-nitrite reductase large subunit